MNEKIIKLEKLLLRDDVRKDQQKLEELLDPNFIEVIPSGERWTRSQIIDALLSSPDSAYEASNFKTSSLTEDLILVNYITTNPAGVKAIRSSLWKNNNNDWTMIFHQGTLIIK